MKFFVCEILDATPRSRFAGQGGSRRETGRNDLDAATGDPQSNLRFTRTTPATAPMIGVRQILHEPLQTDVRKINRQGLAVATATAFSKPISLLTRRIACGSFQKIIQCFF